MCVFCLAALYTGSLSTPLLAALNHAGSHVTASDLANYTALEHDALSVTLGQALLALFVS